MTKTFNFYTKNNNNNTSNIFRNYEYTNYSKVLDDLIATDVIKDTASLFESAGMPIILTGSKLKGSDDFANAANFLANYKTYKKTYKIPYILGKMYTLYDGTPVIFYDDEIQIGFDVYKYSNFSDLSFLNNLTTSTKKVIINIYTTGKCNININL